MKKTYKIPELTAVEFSSADVIATSGIVAVTFTGGAATKDNLSKIDISSLGGDAWTKVQ